MKQSPLIPTVLRSRHTAGPAGPARGPLGPPSGFTLLPWLLMGMGAVSNLIKGDTPNPLAGGLGVLVFNSLYISVVFRSFDARKRRSAGTRWSLAVMGAVTGGLALAYGGSWLLFFPLLGLATGTVVRGRSLGPVMIALSAVAGAVAGYRDGWDAIGVVYGTFLSGMVTAAILALSETVRELRETRQELARTAVEEERLRFSRDLHDLLGHTLSVIVVKAEAARRIAPRDMDAALVQIGDIESVGRQALTEIREAVTGYREASLGDELDRACGALTAAGIEPRVRQCGPALPARTAALLGWVVRESVTNVIRHSAAATCEIEVGGTAERARVVITDDGGGGVGSAPPGSGLTGLAERLAAAGGTLRGGPAAGGGFRVTAELPLERSESGAAVRTANEECG
ncbi:histidine kinase [Streptomyces sp. CB00455]|uniref:sensor histidine kinase n=1 Tax=Streptomyces sp. CB00455 TaxID=1703927 RepID=UPI000967A32E|nr:sensor histidine kinase [Streptomyces sp. CB00455]OKK22968.1 histidine kinase [Streptomyces sp. CB00455]